jgi:hypothetical protein
VTPRLEAAWAGLVDDAAIFPPGDADLAEAARAHLSRRREQHADLVGAFVLRDTDLPRLTLDTDAAFSVAVVVTGGAGQIAGPARLCRDQGRDLAALEIALRDPDDLAGNARRVGAAVDAARSEGLLDDETPVYVELPHVGSSASWLAAADVVAEHEFRLKLRTGGLEQHLFPSSHALARWIDAALDRETPFKCTAGLHHAVRHTSDEGFEHHGFVNVLLATRRFFDGDPLDEVVALLERRDGSDLAEDARAADLAGARRWFTSFGSCSVTEPLDDLIALGLVSTGSTNEGMP